MPLAHVARRHGARRVVIAGDLFEATAAPALVGDLLDWFRGASLELVGVVPGNHDRDLSESAGRLPVCAEGIELGGWRVLHGDGELPAGPVIHGHLHPFLRWRGLAAPCYLVGPERLILPAYSGDAAGAGVLRSPRWRSYRCCVVAGDRVLDFGELGRLGGFARGRL
jgi:metallophosphoesterase superfamily enzyme